MPQKRPVALIILDGLGIRRMVHGNAVTQANTPNLDRWMRSGERAILDASGEAVGLPQDQMGNSEVGHLNLGAGRIVYQDITRIDMAVSDGSLAQNSTLQTATDRVKASSARLHLLGLLGTGGVHSHSRHLYALIDLLHKQNIQPILHMITDGRDTPPESAAGFVQDLEAFLAPDTKGTIATISGRYYAMDRDKRWERTLLAYNAMVHGEGLTAPTAGAAIAQSYAAGTTDEFILPTIIEQDDAITHSIRAGDSVICFNFRADRMRQMVRLLTNSLDDMEIDSTLRPEPLDPLYVYTMTEYEEGLPVEVIFEKQKIVNPLPEVLEKQGKRQFHAAETEKYAHVTYFFNGGNEEQFPGEERLLVQSPKVATYDLQPEMSAHELADKVVARIKSGIDDFILVNFANPDMVGHTGDLQAAIKAVETVDVCANRLVQAIVAQGGVALVTADHGNAERMIDEVTGTPHTYHTTSPVSLLAVGNGDEYIGLRPRGILADVAPTLLALMGIPQPAEMTGRSLLTDEL